MQNVRFSSLSVCDCHIGTWSASPVIVSRCSSTQRFSCVCHVASAPCRASRPFRLLHSAGLGLPRFFLLFLSPCCPVRFTALFFSGSGPAYCSYPQSCSTLWLLLVSFLSRFFLCLLVSDFSGFRPLDALPRVCRAGSIGVGASTLPLLVVCWVSRFSSGVLRLGDSFAGPFPPFCLGRPGCIYCVISSPPAS